MTEEITVQQAARRTRKSPETIRRWIWSGRLPATKRGNTYYIGLADLEQVVEIGAQSWHGDESGQGGGVGGDAEVAGGLGDWLAEVGQWKAGRANRTMTSTSAAELVIEDRHARR
jgi:excisionase family DNA binding protein